MCAGVSGRTELGPNARVMERQARRISWYTDRKHYLLGTLIPDEMLAGTVVPKG